jgi:putative membrane protein insertion efficiency factor
MKSPDQIVVRRSSSEQRWPVFAGLARLASALLSLPIRVYRYAISPMLPASCRFFPSCSEYALDALRRHGPVTGSWLTLSRVCRCHPWNHGGLDPVPDTFPPSNKTAVPAPGGAPASSTSTTRTAAPIARQSRWPTAQRGQPPARTD